MAIHYNENKRDQPRREFEERLARAGLDIEDYAREEDRLRDIAAGEIPAIETSKAVEAQILRTLELQEKLGEDALTGAFNLRRYREETNVLQARVVAGTRRRVGDIAEIPLQKTFSIIAFDIDHFKQINDIYGHAAGDQVLQELVRRVQKRLRKGDILARCGGEEFRVVALAINGNAPHLAEDLRQLIAGTPFRIKGNDGIEHDLRVTISLGVSLYHQDTHTMEVRSDAALYAAKGKDREGSNRNQVWLWDREKNESVPYEPDRMHSSFRGEEGLAA